jgi:glycosyltransferase involved in cell wall biosynthesis
LRIADLKFIFYTPQKISWLPLNKQKIFGPRRLWTIIGLSWQLLKNKPDALFIPVHALPFFCPKKTYKIIHDTAFKRQPNSYSLFQKIYFNFDLKRCLKICAKIFVPTSQVKTDLVQYFHADPEKIIIIPHGHTSKNTQPPTLNRQSQILYIGRIEEKKNILNLVAAFQTFNQRHPEYSLILAGKPGYGFNEIQSTIKNLKSKIINLGHVTDEQKYKLLGESSCLVLVSKDEGFGIPLLEAFDFNLPVLASNIPVLHEVGDNACLYTNPDNPAQIAHDLEKIIFDDKLKQELINNGRERLKQFDWQKTTNKILQILLSR